MKTPRFISRTLAAGAFTQIGASGKFLTIISITAGVFEVSIDGESPEQVRAGLQIQVSRGFSLLRVRNSGIVAGTIICYVSDEPLGQADASIAAALANIDGDTDQLLPSTTHVNIPFVVAAQDGVGDTQIVPASALNRDIEINADFGNADYVYLSHVNPATAANAFTCLQAGGCWTGRTTQEIRACSTNGTEGVRGVIRRA